MPQIKNPFEKEDWFGVLIEEDKKVNSLSRSSFQSFLKNNKRTSKPMTFSEKYLNFTHLIAKNAFLATAIMVFAITTVGASAAEVFAPKEYKPSTTIQKTFNPEQFKTNKQVEKDPFTALKSDVNNDVVSLDGCDLAVKYPKKVGKNDYAIFSKADYDKNPVYNGPGVDIPGEKGYVVMGKKYFENPYQNPDNNDQFISITCSTNEIRPGDNGIDYKMSKAELSKLTGWFITAETELENIMTEDPLISSPFKRIYFKHAGNYYSIWFTSKTVSPAAFENEKKNDPASADYWLKAINQNGLYGDQVQIQFSSLVKNEPNTTVIEKPKPDTTQNLETFLNEEFTVMGGGQMRYKNDSSGGFELLNIKTGKTYALLASLKEKSALEFKSGDKIKLSGKAEKVDLKEYAGGLVEPSFVIVEINSFQNSSTSSQNSSKTTSPTGKTETYTNQYFPGLKLTYDNSWKFTTTTTNSQYPGLLNRRLELKKDNALFTVELRPKIETFSETKGKMLIPNNTSITKFSNGLVKYDDSKIIGIPQIVYGADAIMLKYLVSNIKSSDYPNYLKNTKNEDQFVTYESQPMVTYYDLEAQNSANNRDGPYFANSINPQLQAEIDQIISQSTFN